MVVSDACLEELFGANSSWRLLSTVRIAQLVQEQWTFLASQCMWQSSSHHLFYTLRFHPALYFESNTTFSNYHLDVSEFFLAKGSVLQEYGVQRQLPSMLGSRMSIELPDALWLGLCVPHSCHSDISFVDGILDVVLPAWFAHGVDALPPAGCCARLLSRYWMSSNKIVSQQFELRDRFYKSWNVNTMVRRRDFDCADTFVSDEHFLGQLFGAALQARLVRQHGSSGRLWQIIRENDWEIMESLTLKDYETCVGAGHRYVSVQLGDLFDDDVVALKEYFGMCVPQSCDDEAVFQTVVPALTGKNMYTVIEGMRPWSALPINFVLAGFAKCGTSTLAATLHKHPHVFMSRCHEEPCENAIWSTDYRLDFLLPHSAIIEVATSFAGGIKHMPIVRGVKDSRLLEEDASIAKLSRIAHVKVIVVIRDPIEALESHYNAMECWKIRSLHEMAEAGLTDCITHRGWGVWSERINKLQSMLPGGLGSIFIVHLSTITSTNLLQSETFRAMLRFLGIPHDDFAFDGAFSLTLQVRNRFSRDRAHEPHLVDICAPEYRATLDLLRFRYASEYSQLAALLSASGAEAPPDFTARRMRCDMFDLPTRSRVADVQ